jgi:Tol biopolymer transport system component
LPLLAVILIGSLVCYSMLPFDSTAVEQPIHDRRFWVGTFLFLVFLGVVSVLIWLQGNQARVRARQLIPEPGSIVSGRPAIGVTLARPVLKESVESVVAITPTVPFDLSWSENQLRIRPRVALVADRTYTITVGPGIQDASGAVLEGQIQWHFRTHALRLVFLRSVNDQPSELWLTGNIGEASPGHRLSAPGQDVEDFDVAPDGSVIVYTVSDGPDSINLWRVLVDHPGWTQLTQSRDVIYSAPSFDPTGDLLAVEIREQVQIGDQGTRLSPPRLELRRPHDGSPAGQIYGGRGAVGHTARWSPDGTHLAFFEPTKGAIGLFNFTDEVRFFRGESVNIGPQAWSPDGRFLVYTRIRLSGESAQQVIATRDLQGGTETFFDGRQGNLGDPVWSPDGAFIAYSYQPDDATRGSQIWLQHPDGTGQVALVADPAAILAQPLWSPDGQWLTLTRLSLTNRSVYATEIWVVQRDGKNFHKVADSGFLQEWVP